MTATYNIYCDESCHLENDRQKAMVLGAVWCPEGKAREIAIRLRGIKVKHSLGKDFELKWTKVSPAKLNYYVDVLNYFFDDDDLCFRALIVPDKAQLRHIEHDQDHDEWYYKMYFNMLKTILNPEHHYKVYIDIKDTHSAKKLRKLHDVLCNNIYDFDRKIIERIQAVHSYEVEQVQLSDMLIGIIGYINRGLSSSASKCNLVRRMQERSGYSLTRSTLVNSRKVNLFHWRPKGAI